MEMELGGVDGIAVEVEVVEDEGLARGEGEGDGVAVPADEAFDGWLGAGGDGLATGGGYVGLGAEGAGCRDEG